MRKRQGILIGLLLLPQALFGYCTKGLWDACGWWGYFDYLLLWRKERFLPPLVSTGTLGDGGILLFGDELVGRSPHSGFRFDGGIWCCDTFAFGGGVILAGTERVSYGQNTDQEPDLARPYIDATTGLPASWTLLPFGQISVTASNYFSEVEGYVRSPLLGGDLWNVDGMVGALYLNLGDSLDVNSLGTGFIVEINDHFHCNNSFYAGMGGLVGEFATGCWRVNLWGQLAIGNMVKETVISGKRRSFLNTFSDEGLLALNSNIGRHANFQCEVVTLCGVDMNLKLCQGVHLTCGYLLIYLPRVALAGDQVDLNLDLAQDLPAPQYRLHDTNFWLQGFSVGLSVFY